MLNMSSAEAGQLLRGFFFSRHDGRGDGTNCLFALQFEFSYISLALTCKN